MSTLQCAATLLLARPGAPERLAAALAGRRVARVWADDDAGGDVAARLGVGVTPLPGGELDVGAVLDDEHGLAPEMVLERVPSTCRMRVPAGRLAPDETVELLADADGRVCVRWGPA